MGFEDDVRLLRFASISTSVPFCGNRTASSWPEDSCASRTWLRNLFFAPVRHRQWTTLVSSYSLYFYQSSGLPGYGSLAPSVLVATKMLTCPRLDDCIKTRHRIPFVTNILLVPRHVLFRQRGLIPSKV